MIGIMGSFAYPSADLNDPLYVLFRAIPSSWVTESEPQDVLGEQNIFDTSQACLVAPVLASRKRY